MMAITWEQVLDLVAALLMFAGGLLALAAAIGVLRFPDMVTRMHAGAKPLTLGLVLAVGGLALTLRDPYTLGLLVLIVGLQVMTVPVSAHMVARVAYRRQVIDVDTLVVDELADDLTGAGYDRVVTPDSTPDSAAGPEPGVDEPSVPGSADDALGEEIAAVDDDDRHGDMDQEGERPAGDQPGEPMSPPQQRE